MQPSLYKMAEIDNDLVIEEYSESEEEENILESEKALMASIVHELSASLNICEKHGDHRHGNDNIESGNHKITEENQILDIPNVTGMKNRL